MLGSILSLPLAVALLFGSPAASVSHAPAAGHAASVKAKTVKKVGPQKGGKKKGKSKVKKPHGGKKRATKHSPRPGR